MPLGGCGYAHSMDAENDAPAPGLIRCGDSCVAFGPEGMTATSYEDGPILVRGAEGLIDAEGRLTRVERRVVGVCRCGRSSLAPLCDGTHRFVFPRISQGPQRSP